MGAALGYMRAASDVFRASRGPADGFGPLQPDVAEGAKGRHGVAKDGRTGRSQGRHGHVMCSQCWGTGEEEKGSRRVREG